MKKNKLPSQEYLHLNFYYNPKIGKMYARYKSGGKPIGISGYVNKVDGYRYRSIKGKLYSVHRLIWMYVYGEDPGKKDIDHIDGDTTNNKIDNLRLATRRQNAQNQTNAKGYTWREANQKWQVQISWRGKVRHVGYFTCELLAKQAADDTKARWFKEFAPNSIYI